MDDVLIKAENVSKKFAIDLKRSLYYGVKDVLWKVGGKERKNELRKSEFWAVKNISFELKRGECLGLIGHNGAGKSTLLKMLNGLINPDEGSIMMRGKVGALIELGAGFNPILTGRENIYNNAAVMGFSKKEVDAKFDEIVTFSEIGEFLDMPVQNYSSGMKVRLGFAVAAQMEPDILLIDEVLAVGDVGFRIKCLNRIQELLKHCAVIFVSHSMPQIGKICTHTMLLNKGEVSHYSQGNLETIEKYFDMFETEATSEFGTGKCKLISFEAIGLKLRNETYYINKGETFHFRFSLKVDSKYKQIYCAFLFHDLELRTVARGTGIENDFIINNQGEELNIEIKIPNLLSIGKYSISLNVFEIVEHNGNLLQGDMILSKRSFLKIYSRGHKQVDFCPIQLPCEWTMQ